PGHPPTRTFSDQDRRFHHLAFREASLELDELVFTGGRARQSVGWRCAAQDSGHAGPQRLTSGSDGSSKLLGGRLGLEYGCGRLPALVPVFHVNEGDLFLSGAYRGRLSWFGLRTCARFW